MVLVAKMAARSQLRPIEALSFESASQERRTKPRNYEKRQPEAEAKTKIHEAPYLKKRTARKKNF